MDDVVHSMEEFLRWAEELQEEMVPGGWAGSGAMGERLLRRCFLLLLARPRCLPTVQLPARAVSMQQAGLPWTRGKP